MPDTTRLPDRRMSAMPRAITRPSANDASASGIVPVRPAPDDGQKSRGQVQPASTLATQLSYSETSSPKYFSPISASVPSAVSSASAASMASTRAALSFVNASALTRGRRSRPRPRGRSGRWCSRSRGR